ncbi:MAG: hypothetical protein Q9219_000156 [cf. Caloplaca sp. 3 TL-2023]
MSKNRPEDSSLSRPSFSEQFRLPQQPEDEALPIDPSVSADDNFICSPLLTLPPAFGSAYVGETFSCTLCANNELPNDTNRKITDVSITTEIQAPTQTISLDLSSGDREKGSLEPKESLQKIVRFDLKEEGNHVLAVSIKYTERMLDADDGSRGRARTFTKLYQFQSAPCIAVRSKVSDLASKGLESEKRSHTKRMSFVLEAQLENMADGPITLAEVACSPKKSFDITSINWETSRVGAGKAERPFLMARDVTQAAFLVKQRPNTTVELTKDGRVILGQLLIRWRTSMGDPGSLTTGWLTTRKRP